jgi:Protein of unknown function (DUF3990)
MGGYAYASDNPASQADPTGLYIPDAPGDTDPSDSTIEYKIDNGEGFDTSSAATYQANIGGWTDLLGGAVNTLYHTARSLNGLMPMGVFTNSLLPARIPLGNPNTTSYNTGGFYANAGMLLAGAGGEDLADGLGVVTSKAAAEDYIDLYHGTSEAYAADIQSNGIDLGAGKANRDFGQGFYTTRDPAQAAKWASQNFGSSGTVIQYRVPASMFKGLSGRVFPDASDDYLDMVSSMRSGGPMHFI